MEKPRQSLLDVMVEERGAKRMTQVSAGRRSHRGTPIIKGDEKTKQVLKAVKSSVG